MEKLDQEPQLLFLTALSISVADNLIWDLSSFSI